MSPSSRWFKNHNSDKSKMKRVLPIFLTFFALTLVLPGKVLAACGPLTDPEFHSLRPYQASPCQNTTDNFAKFCGNNLTLHDTITETYPGNGSCTTANGKITCNYNETVTIPDLTIDLSIASLPIMGNTEEVANSKNSKETLDDAQKVNNYVSWYLNGVNYRAEYGNTKTDADSLINYSGPLNKLLPSIILDAQRIKTISSAGSANHNQIVVCGENNLGFAGDLAGLGKVTPKACYDGNGGSTKAKAYRLEDWNRDLSSFNGLNDLLSKAVSNLSFIIPGGVDTAKIITDSIGNAWNDRKPPLPWDARFKGNDKLYLKAYNEWHGKACALVPVINLLICLDNPLVSKTWSDLYPYVPLSGTEDLEGKMAIDSVSSATNPALGGVTVKNVGFSNQIPSTLFFPHMQESDELANLLQSTFVASGLNSTGNPTDIASETSCKELEVRTNKGDNLFAKQLTGNVSYNASFSCEFSPSTSTNNSSCMQDCLAGENTANESINCSVLCSSSGAIKTQSCTKDIYISLSTISSTPKVDDIWSRLVAGPASVFKRIFPKTNVVGGIGQIMDIPGSTKITYTGTGIGQSNADIKFPHIGGVSEYFLKGIQTMLRPKGFGEPISFAPATGNGLGCESGGTSVDGAISDVSAKYGVPEKLLYAIFRMEDGSKYLQDPEGYVCEENRAGAAGVTQITPSTYKLVTCEDERLENSLECSQKGKLSRCVIQDSFELTARTLMWLAGVWPTGSCTPSGKFPNNKQAVYKASCEYYGSFSPDALTIHAAQQFGLPNPESKNYCDVICSIMGDCPPFP
jgi:hypothetical protein